MNWLAIAELLYAESMYIAEQRIFFEHSSMCFDDLGPIIAELARHEKAYFEAALECRHLADLEEMGPNV